jgi:hypothetical protein
MENKILTEIKRIHQLMMVNPKILNEQVPPSLVRNVLKYGDELIDDLMKLIKNEDEAADIASKIEKAAQKGETLSDDFYAEIIKKTTITDLAGLLKNKGLLGNIRALDTKFLESADKMLAINQLNNELIEKYIEKYRKSLDGYRALSDEMKDGLTEIFENEIKSKYPNIVSKNVDADLKKIEDGLIDDLNSTSNNIKSNIASSYIPEFVRFFTKYWRNVFRSDAKLNEKIKTTIDAIITKSKNNQPYDIDFENLYMYVLAKRKSRDFVLQPEMEKLIFKNPKISKQVKTLMDDKDAFKLIKSSWEAVKKTESTNTYGPALEQLHANLESLPITNLVSKLSKDGPATKKDFLRAIFPEPKRLMNMVSWKDPRSVKETVAHITRYGRNRTISSKIITFLVMQHGLLPLILASFKTLKQNWNSGKSYVELATVKEFCKTVKELYPDKPELEQCKTLPKTIETPTKEDFLNYYKESLPFDYFDMNPYGEDSSTIKNLFFWTLWDEIISTIGSTFHDLMFEPFNPQVIDNLYNTMDNKVKLKLKEFGWDPNKSNEENMKIVNEKFKNEKDDLINNVTDWYEEVKSKGLEIAFNEWGKTQPGTPKYVKEDEITGAIIATNNKKYELQGKTFVEFK